ncbi:hypothetical protein PSTT_12002 [Puccinia striiformis]|uniref:Type 1 phosphatases regulator n=1 Tax=Puccinia striiformis TaxID=27350 RepID=A0A2S4UYD1_9BASI|nr:hypothetical protein PSTT_12002 [Puccinia striiformis]
MDPISRSQSHHTGVRQNDRSALTAGGSRTMVINQNSGSNRRDESQGTDNSNPTPTLILRAGPIQNSQHRQQRVQWQDNVIDNEGLGRKKSKVCCIYNKPKAFDESSDESDHSDSDCCRTSGPKPCTSTTSTTQATSQPTQSHSLPTPPRSPNAYEAEPNKSKGKGKA